MTEYYLLRREHLAPFLPFLTPEQQRGALAGQLLAAGAAENGEAIAAAGLRIRDEEARLERVAVSPEHQRRGVAQGLLRYLSEVLPLLDCGRLWTDLSPAQGEDSPEALLLRCAGFEPEEGPAVASCPIAALLTSPMLAPLMDKEVAGIYPLEEVPPECLHDCQKHLLAQGITAAPLDWENFDPQLSYCGLNARGEISSCVCTRRQTEDLSVEWIYATPAGAKQLIFAVVALLRLVRDKLPPDARFSAVILDDRAANLLDRLAGDAVTYTHSTRWTKDLLAGL